MFTLLLSLLPLICASEYSLTIEEKTSIHQTIFRFSRPHELINNFQSTFQLTNNSEQLIATKLIDRDAWCASNLCSCDRCSFVLDFVSVDDRSPSSLNITILDVNDHTCQFLDLQENISLSESIQIGHRFPIARAIDYDSADLGRLSFQLLNHTEYFQLNVITLSTNEYAIYGVVQRSFDRELKDNFQLLIEGRDHGRPHANVNRTKVTVWILDENDNAPKFNQTEYSIQSLAEDTPMGTELLTIFASDADQGLNGLIHYSIVLPPNQSTLPFAINSSTGVVSLRSALDYETTRSYRFLIRASDSGLSQSLSTDSWLSITITDVNDCPVEIVFTPHSRFPYDNQTLSIYENTEIQNLTLGSIRLSDRDSLATKLSVSLLVLDSSVKQEYELLPSSQLNLYTLIVKEGIFDREVQSDIRLRFIASDTQLTSTYDLTIHLMDLNDNPSEFPSNPMKFAVEELANYHIVEHPMENEQLTIGYLKAFDRDQGDNAVNRFELESNAWLKIDGETGRLYSLQPFDREQISLIVLKAKAINIAEPKWITEVRVEIQILDVNDHVPRCVSPISRISIPENFSIAQPLIKINASDLDAGVNGTIGYSFRMNGTWPLEMNRKTGELFSRQAFDYESDWKHFSLEIDLEDHGSPVKHQHRNACRVEIDIEDVNDHAPELIDPSQQQIFIDLRQPFQHEIVRLLVEDADAGDNGRVKYTLLSDDEQQGLFVLFANGSLQMTRPWNEVALFNLRVLLEDHGVPSEQTTINLTIAIGDTSIPSFASFAQVQLKYSRPKYIGLIFGLTILLISFLLLICLIVICVLLRRHRRRHQAAIIARKTLLCSSSQQLTSSGSTNTTSSSSIEHQPIQIKPTFWEEKFYDQQSYTVDTSSPESRTYKILHIPQENEHYLPYYQQEKIDNHSSDLGYHGSYETGSSSSPSQVSIPRSYMVQHLPDFVRKCKSVSDGFLVEMNVDGSDEDAR